MACQGTRRSLSFPATTVAALIASYLLRTTALRVTRPTEDEVITAERPYTVAWEGALNSAKFEVDLHYCGPYSICFERLVHPNPSIGRALQGLKERGIDEKWPEEEYVLQELICETSGISTHSFTTTDDCGDYLQSLCLEGMDCQPATNGNAEVTFPEPLNGISSSGYRVRITEVGGGPLDFACSEDFVLRSSYESQHTVGEEWVLGDPSIMVVSPFEGSVALAGEPYTVEFDYDRRYGEGANSFKMDLYSLEGTGDCGGWITSICDTPDTGCPAFHGGYDVVIPVEASTGTYRVRVGVFEDDSVFGCSEPFRILAGGDALWNFV